MGRPVLIALLCRRCGAGFRAPLITRLCPNCQSAQRAAGVNETQGEVGGE